MVGNVTGLTERLHEIVGRVVIVLNDEKTHDKSLFAAFSKSRKAIPADDNPPAAPATARGGERQARHPYLLRPGGGDGCRSAEWVICGDGPCDPPPGYARQRGRRMPADAPFTKSPGRCGN